MEATWTLMRELSDSEDEGRARPDKPTPPREPGHQSQEPQSNGPTPIIVERRFV